jgi:carboxyl-terminal processing protease
MKCGQNLIKRLKKYIVMTAAAALITSGISVTASANDSVIKNVSVAVQTSASTVVQTSDTYVPYTTLDEAREIIESEYANSIPDGVLNASTIDAMVKGLNDPYSQYFTAKEYDDFVGEINNSYCGIGVYINSQPEGIGIIGVIENSPAASIGLKIGDVIVKAGGQSLKGLSIEQASAYLKGPEDTTVAIQVLRDGKYYDYIVKREVINSPTIQGYMINNHAAYIEISSFGDNTPDEFKAKLDELKKSNPDCYIIDLRNDGGGYTDSCYDIAGYFIGNNPVVKMVDKDGNAEIINAVAHDEIIDKPTYFLVNEWTASASEILSAAVKDYNKAYFIGTNTFGKGCAQYMYQLSDGSVLKLTTRNFYSPLGKTIQKVGITPDFAMNKDEDIDSLAVALLLSGSSGSSGSSQDKTGYVKVNLDGRDFEMNLNTARDEDYTSAFKYIISKSNSSSIYVGTKDGWVRPNYTSAAAPSLILSSDYESKPNLDSVSPDKQFTIKFNTDVDMTTVTSDDLRIIDEVTGESVAYDIVSSQNGALVIKPKALLLSGHSYDVLIDGGIKGKGGQALAKGVITKCTVK